jgi:hypothetical protein
MVWIIAAPRVLLSARMDVTRTLDARDGEGEPTMWREGSPFYLPSAHESQDAVAERTVVRTSLCHNFWCWIHTQDGCDRRSPPSTRRRPLSLRRRTHCRTGSYLPHACQIMMSHAQDTSTRGGVYII